MVTAATKIKTSLLLERKVMTNLDSMLKSRDITLLTKVCIVKAMVFPAVICRCESWTTKQAECWKFDAFKLWYWRRLEIPLDCKEIQPVSPKRNQAWMFIGRIDAKASILGYLMQRASSFEKTLMLGKTEGKRRRGQQRKRWLDSITDSMDMNLSKLQETVKDREAWHAAVHRVSKSWTWFSDWTTNKEFMVR